MADYSLAAKCGAEMIGTCFAIYMGEAVIANELLAKTKGRGMGWVGVSFGFGLPFGFVIYMFSFISAQLNPAVVLALWITGQVSFTQFLALSASELVGAFFGGCLVFLHFLPHFNILPEPPEQTSEDLLLRSRDARSRDALDIASYDTHQHERMAHGGSHGLKAGLAHGIRDIRYYFASPDQHSDHVEVPMGRSDGKNGEEDLANSLRRRSAQEFKDKLPPTPGMHRTTSASVNLTDLDCMTSRSLEEGLGSTPGAGKEPRARRGDSSHEDADNASVGHESTLAAAASTLRQAYQSHVQKFGNKERELHDAATAAIVADQNAKLSIFCTRPAIYAPACNFLCEALCTTALVFGALMMGERAQMLEGEFRALLSAINGIYVGFFVVLLVMVLGGPTGIAANPARDFGPRVAHALLPIAGKGSSEWFYSWVPVFAPFTGGAIGAGIFMAVQKMNHSSLP